MAGDNIKQINAINKTKQNHMPCFLGGPSREI